jgi:hypothetical protein
MQRFCSFDITLRRERIGDETPDEAMPGEIVRSWYHDTCKECHELIIEEIEKIFHPQRVPVTTKE